MLQRFAILACALSAFVAPALADSAEQPAFVRAPIIMEVFTSEGCTACPRANKYVSGYAHRDEVLPITFAVDYWDYLGWKDSHARPEFAERQKTYAARFGLSGPYTPQIIVMGADETRGSTTGRIEAAVQRAGLEHPATTHVTATAAPTGWRVALSGPQTNADIWLVAFEPGHRTVTPKAGLNAGHEMVLTNVASSLQRVAEWTGGAAELDVTCENACAVLVQEKQGGAIIGAAKIG